MKIVPPIIVTDALLTATNVPETGYSEWSSITAYTTGQFVQITTTDTHRVYEALAGSTNKPPATEPTYWLDIGPTNTWAMFDGKTGTVTSSSAAFVLGAGTGIEVEVTPGGVFNSVIVFDAFADTLRIEVIDPIEGTVYDEIYSMLDNSEIVDWYAYFFSPILRASTKAVTDLPSYGSAKVRVSLDKDTDPAVCGTLVIGSQILLGATSYGAQVGILDYSIKQQDEFGVFSILEREYSNRATFDVVLAAAKTSGVLRTLTRYRATPIVWIGEEKRESTILYGYFRDFNIILSTFSLTDMSIEIEGLT